MKLTKMQKNKIIKNIIQKLKDCRIVLVDDETSEWNNIQIIDEDYFIEKLQEALE
jgi:hypothetical protein